MRKVLFIIALLVTGFASAQTENPVPIQDMPANVNKKGDTITTNQQIRKETDLQTMDAVKTQDHVKTTPEPVMKKRTSTKAKKKKTKRYLKASGQ